MPTFEPTWEIRHAVALIGLFAALLLVRLLAQRVFHVDSGGFRALWRTTVLAAAAIALLAVLDGLGLVAMGTVLRAISTAANHTMITLSGVDITPATVVVFLLLLGATWWGSVFVRETTERTLSNRGIGDPGTRASAARLIQYAVGAVGMAVALQSVGIDLGALVTAGAVFAVGIGFAMQNIAQNFVSGVILLAERSISPGDIVVVEGQMVRIRTLGIRATIARTLDDEEIIIPNSFLVQSNVKNLTLDDSTLRVRLPVGVAYDSDLDEVFRVLKSAADGMTARLPREPAVTLTAFGSSSVDFEVSIWIDDPWQRHARRSDLAKAVWDALAAADVVIAFPQLDLHVDDELREALIGRPAVKAG